MRKLLCFRRLSLLAVVLTLGVSLSVVGTGGKVTHAASGPSMPASLANCQPHVRVVASPSPGSAYNFLFGITAVSAHDLWAVGRYQNPLSPEQTLIERWNQHTWSVVSSPNPGSASNTLFGVAAVSANDVWAVGRFQNPSSPEQTLIEHWDGQMWSVVSSPDPSSTLNFLLGITVVSARNVWAVGGFQNASGITGTLIEHWNGQTWSVVSSQSPGSASNTLFGVAAVSANNVWAAGDFLNPSGPEQTLIEHWNGHKWSIVSSPSPGSALNFLFGITAASANSVWAVGGFQNTSSPDQALIEYWNGQTWSVVSSPSPGLVFNTLFGIAAVSTSNLWAVGGFQNPSAHDQTLIEHIAGSCQS